MTVRSKCVSAIVLICFLFNTSIAGFSHGSPVETAPLENLSVASMCDDLMGIQHKDIGRIKLLLQAQLDQFTAVYKSKGMAPITFSTLKTVIRKQSQKEETIFQPADTQLFFNEATFVEEGVRIMCRIKDQDGTRTYYAVFKLQPDKDGRFPIMGIYTEREYESNNQLVELLPKRLEKDQKAIDRYVQHEMGMDAAIRYAHENDLAAKPFKRKFNYQKTVISLLRNLNIDVTTPEGRIPIEKREFYLVKLTPEVKEMIDKLPKAKLVNDSGKEFEVAYFAHSSNNAVHVFVDEDDFDIITGEKYEPYNEKIGKAIENIERKLVHEIGVMLGMEILNENIVWNRADERYISLKGQTSSESLEETVKATVVDLDKNLLTRDYAAAQAQSPLAAFAKIDENIWVDGLTMDMLKANGKFEELVRDHGITGVTTNPSLIKAYLNDEEVLFKAQQLAREGLSVDEVYFELIKDLAMTVISIFKKYDVDGKFSVELDPTKASDVDASVEEALRWIDIAPVYMMVKVAANEEGYKIIEEVTAKGRNVNATLIFTPEQYREVAEAYIRGLERALWDGLDLSKIYSVASFFISRWDAKLVGQVSDEYHGMFANSIAISAYNKVFMELFNSERFQKLASRGAGVQDFLLASTGSKASKFPEEIKDKYPEDVYVAAVQGADIVNTLPVKTIDYLIENGVEEKATILENAELAEKVLEDMQSKDVDIDAEGEELFAAGMKSFLSDFSDIKETIAKIVKETQVDDLQDKDEVPAAYQIEEALSIADQAGKEVLIHPNDRYTLLMTSEFFANGELENHKHIYGDRFNVDSVSAKTPEQFIDKVLARAKDIENKTIVLVSSEIPAEQLERLGKAGVRFIRTNTTALLEAKKAEKEERRNMQQNTYTVMLLTRSIDENTTPESSIYRLLDFYLGSLFHLRDIEIEDYIKAIITSDISMLIKGLLSYKPMKQYETPEYDKVAATMIAA